MPMTAVKAICSTSRNGTSDKQTLAIKNISTLDKEMEPGDAVRFATVKNPGFGFGSGTLVAALSSGIYNNLYKTEYRSLSSDALNTAAYNNDRNGGSTYSVSQEVGPLNFAKPGTEMWKPSIMGTAPSISMSSRAASTMKAQRHPPV